MLFRDIWQRANQGQATTLMRASPQEFALLRHEPDGLAIFAGDRT